MPGQRHPTPTSIFHVFSHAEEVTGIDDLENDDCVTVQFLRGEGMPMIGTDGLLIDGQSFSRALELDKVTGARIIDGSLVASPLEVHLEVDVLDKLISFNLLDGGIRIDLDPAKGAHGFFAGAVSMDELLTMVSYDEVGITELLIELLQAAADIAPDEQGQCRAISSAFEYTAIPAHFF